MNGAPEAIIARMVADFGYAEKSAEEAVQKLQVSNPAIQAAFEKWWAGKGLDEHLVVEGYTLQQLIDSHGFNPFNAFLTMDWLIRESKRALRGLSKCDYVLVSPEARARYEQRKRNFQSPKAKESFIAGVLSQNKAGATYEGVVYDRRLVLRVPGDRTFSIFDFANPISTELQTGEVYTLVLAPFVVSLNLISASSPSVGLEPTTAFHHWQGIVLDPDWEAPKDAFRVARPGLYEQRWAFVSTAHGNLLLKPGKSKVLSAGTVIQWEHTRLDLYAVL